MIFLSASTQTPEEHSTGVLGRIGSWFSPWRGRGSPRSPSDYASLPLTGDQGPRPEGEGAQEDPVRGEEEQQEEGQNSQPAKWHLSRDFEETDARASTHRDRPLSAASSHSELEEEGEGGGPREEEEWWSASQGEEEGSSGASRNPAPERNASHLTCVFISAPEEGGAWEDSDRQEHTQAHTHTQAQPQAQVQAGKQLHVYLEETSVSQSGTYTYTKQEVLLTTTTRVKKSVQVVPRAKSSKSADLSAENTNTEERSEQRKDRTCLKAAIGVKGHSNYSALVGVSLKSHTETQRAISELSGEKESDTDKDTDTDTDIDIDRDTDTMGRKNSARRRSRKSSSEDRGGASSQENTPTKPQTAAEKSPTSSDNNTPTPGDATPSSSKDKHASVISPETGKQGSTTSSGVTMETRKGVEEAQEDQDTPVHAILAAGEGDMDIHMLKNTSQCRLERRTESAESKRLSIKVSHSEVKFFAKKVMVNPEKDTEDKDTDKGKVKPEVKKRPPDLKKVDEEPKTTQPIVRIADRISLFEGRATGVASPSKSNPRSADVIERPRTDVNKELGLPDQRAKLVERGNASSSSTPPVPEKLTTVQEWARNFAEAQNIGG
ncbi:hypothetical protein J4Q44_G00317500 [Coregonus suidteri]|uniref:Uncharacterized protein n=1 Tax=Coregonus suidteri TaxID=861788 RepID=A0AAN8KR00_9TELE